MSTGEAGTEGAAVDLYWLPLGAGDARCVRWSGRLFERLTARFQRRDPLDLYHSALIVRTDAGRYTIEMAPVWGGPAEERGAVGEGPVGSSLLGRSRWFRYEVRCWPDGVIPDLADAVDSPRRLSAVAATAELLVASVPDVPMVTWGRDELRTGEMWNSNSVISWLLVRSGHDVSRIGPPPHGRAPGWAAGIAVATNLTT